jgi:hypothetical protein
MLPYDRAGGYRWTFWRANCLQRRWGFSLTGGEQAEREADEGSHCSPFWHIRECKNVKVHNAKRDEKGPKRSSPTVSRAPLSWTIRGRV